MKKNKVINISKKTFLNVVAILAGLIVFTILLTYLIPKGEFLTTIGENGETIVHFDQYLLLDSQRGINIFKGIFSPILTLFSKDGLSIIMLSLFLCVISSSFQIMSDCDGMKVIVKKMIERFHKHKKVLMAIIVLIFMILGSFFGLFEETLTLLPIIILLSLSMGYDSYLGFLMCTIATGFGFASAITNPFSVLIASNLIGVSPMTNVWYRIIIFLAMYGLLLGFIFFYAKKIEKDPTKSPTYELDREKKKEMTEEKVFNKENSQKIFITYVIFLFVVFITIITVTSLPSLRDYSVVFLIVIFLFGGILSGLIASKNVQLVLKSLLSGFVSALPAVLLVLMASSIKYILVEGKILATITYSITQLIANQPPFFVLLILFGIILILEFFISSSTAKAIFVMGILAGVTMNISKELVVLTYLFGDGYTNVLFPTSPVLLIALSMTGMSYSTWLKKSKFLFLITFLLTILFLLFGLVIHY